MLRASYQLGKINEMLSLSLAVILRDNFEKSKVDMVRTADLNTFASFSFYPYFVLRFVVGSGESKRTQNASLNRFDNFQFIRKGKRFIMHCERADKLFTEQEGKLLLDNDIGKTVVESVVLKDGKRIRFYPMVVPDQETGGDFEGMAVVYNSFDIYALLTFEEFLYLLYLLEHVDLDTLSLQMAQYLETMKNHTGEEVKQLPPTPQMVSEAMSTKETKTETVEGKRPLFFPGTLPNL